MSKLQAVKFSSTDSCNSTLFLPALLIIIESTAAFLGKPDMVVITSLQNTASKPESADNLTSRICMTCPLCAFLTRNKY